MVTFEVTLPDRIESDIDRLVEQGDFLNREQAIEELLSLGVAANESPETSDEEIDEEYFTRTVDEQRDPASQRDEPL